MGQCQSSAGAATFSNGSISERELNKTIKKIEATVLASESEFDPSSVGRSQALTASIASRTTLGGGDIFGGGEKRVPLGVPLECPISPRPTPPPPEPEPPTWEEVDLPEVQDEEAKALFDQAMQILQEGRKVEEDEGYNTEDETEEEEKEEEGDKPEDDERPEVDEAPADKPPEPLELLNKALQRLVKIHKTNELQASTVHLNIGRILDDQGDYKMALRHYRSGQDVLKIQLGKQEPRTRMADHLIKQTFRKLVQKNVKK